MSQKLIGVQLGSHSVFDEGPDHALDTLQRTAGVNTLLIYSHTYQATSRAFDAGAKGLIVSREYDEMRLENLEAVGRAVRDATARGL